MEKLEKLLSRLEGSEDAAAHSSALKKFLKDVRFHCMTHCFVYIATNLSFIIVLFFIKTYLHPVARAQTVVNKNSKNILFC